MTSTPDAALPIDLPLRVHVNTSGIVSIRDKDGDYIMGRVAMTPADAEAFCAWVNSAAARIEALSKVEGELEAERAISANLRLQAQCHAMEARGANATIHEAYQAVTESTGEPGNWHGAEPIKAELVSLRAQLDAMGRRVGLATESISELAKPEMWTRQTLDGTEAVLWTGADYDPEDAARTALKALSE